MLGPGLILVLLEKIQWQSRLLGQLIYVGTRLDSGNVGEDLVTVWTTGSINLRWDQAWFWYCWRRSSDRLGYCWRRPSDSQGQIDLKLRPGLILVLRRCIDVVEEQVTVWVNWSMLGPGSILVLRRSGMRSGDSPGQMIYAETRLDSGTVGEDQVTG